MFTIITVVFLTLVAAAILFKGGSIIKAYNEKYDNAAAQYREKGDERTALRAEAEKVSPLIASGAGGIIFSVAMVILGMNSWTIVEPGHNKVQVLLGSVQDVALVEGFHVVNPILDFVEYDLRDYTQTIDKIEVPAQDKLKSTMDVSITLAADPSFTPKMYQTAGTLDVAYGKYVTPKARSLLREAGKSVKHSQDFFKEEVQQQLQSDLETGLREYLAPKGFIIKAVLIRDIDLPALIRNAIEQTKQRQEEIEQEKAKLLKVEQAALAQVKEAEAREKAAIEDAKAIKTLAKANAFKIVAEAKALAQGNALVNKSLTTKLIEYKRIEQWDGTLPKFTGGGVIPMMDVNNFK